MNNANKTEGNVTHINTRLEQQQKAPVDDGFDFPADQIRGFGESMGLYDRVLSPAYLFSEGYK